MRAHTHPFRSSRRDFLGLVLFAIASVRPAHAWTQHRFDPKELADYRLAPEVFKRFAHATRLIATTLGSDSRFEREPLITKEILVTGDAPDMAAALQKRLDSEPALAPALFAADISSHEYAAFAIALFAAWLAHGFLKSGAMRRVPPGAAADNVAFIAAHDKQVAAVLKQLNLD